MSPDERLKYRGRCRLRMMNEKGVYQYIDNLVQIMENTPSGNVWLIFCLYSLSADQRPEQGIYATITQMESGEVETLFLSEEHRNILYVILSEYLCDGTSVVTYDLIHCNVQSIIVVVRLLLCRKS